MEQSDGHDDPGVAIGGKDKNEGQGSSSGPWAAVGMLGEWPGLALLAIVGCIGVAVALCNFHHRMRFAEAGRRFLLEL